MNLSPIEYYLLAVACFLLAAILIPYKETKMGMFDSLYVPCGFCGKSLEFQSKAGECALRDYTLPDVPPAVAGDLIGESKTCTCGAKTVLEGKIILQTVTTGKLTA
jgi:hypothetical protein